MVFECTVTGLTFRDEEAGFADFDEDRFAGLQRQVAMAVVREVHGDLGILFVD